MATSHPVGGPSVLHTQLQKRSEPVSNQPSVVLTVSAVPAAFCSWHVDACRLVVPAGLLVVNMLLLAEALQAWSMHLTSSSSTKAASLSLPRAESLFGR